MVRPTSHCLFSVVSQFESRDWETDLGLLVTPTMRLAVNVQLHLRATSAQAILKNLEWRLQHGETCLRIEPVP
jgi:hypothetical protein